MDDIDSADELDIDSLMNGSDTEYIAEKEIQPEKDTRDTSIITPEANNHVVSTDPPNEKPKKKDKKQKEEVWKWNKQPSTESRERCKFVPKIRHQFTKNASSMEIFEEFTGLDKLIEMIVTQYNLYTQQNARIFEVDTKEMKDFLGINYIMAIKNYRIIIINYRMPALELIHLTETSFC